jgi:Family of unknown function (DUF6167)
LRRLFWVAFGATAAIIVVHKANKAAHRLTPTGLAETLSEALAEVGDAVRMFAEDVREAMSEREDELQVALGLNATLVPVARETLNGADPGVSGELYVGDRKGKV